MTSRPVAVRAVAFVAPSRWSRRTVRRVRYDALWPSGRVEFDVSLVDAMYRGAPADYSPVAHAVDDRCPELGAGPWIDGSASEIEGPALLEGRPLDAREGRRRRFRPPSDQPRRSSATAWRAAVGLVLLAIGVAGLAATGFEGFAAFGAFVPTTIGLALLGGLLERRRPR
jgi:hypothetical protein